MWESVSIRESLWAFLVGFCGYSYRNQVLKFHSHGNPDYSAPRPSVDCYASLTKFPGTPMGVVIFIEKVPLFLKLIFNQVAIGTKDS